MLVEKIEEMKAVGTGWTRMGGMMPGSINDWTPEMISFGLQRYCGWKVHPSTIQALYK